MVAPNYAKARSDLAKQMGLGQGGRAARGGAAGGPQRPLEFNLRASCWPDELPTPA
jgi:hypothetical protein